MKTIMVEKKSNETINRLNKTKEEAEPDFRALREERDKKERSKERRMVQKQVNFSTLLGVLVLCFYHNRF